MRRSSAGSIALVPHVEQNAVALAVAAADRGRAETAAAPAQAVDQCHYNARAAGTERMTDGNRAAMRISAQAQLVGCCVVVAGEAERAHQHRRGERLVDLDQVELVRGQPVPLQEAFYCDRGRIGARRWPLAYLRIAADAGK